MIGDEINRYMGLKYGFNSTDTKDSVRGSQQQTHKAQLEVQVNRCTRLNFIDTYLCIMQTFCAYFSVFFTFAFTVIIAITLHRAVIAYPAKHAFALVRTCAFTMNTALIADWFTYMASARNKIRKMII